MRRLYPFALRVKLHYLRRCHRLAEPGRRARHWVKLFSTYTLSDEAYAVAVSPEAATWTTRPIVTMQLFLQGLWVTSAALGALLGTALTALFIVLAIEAYRQRPDRLTALTAAGCAVAAWIVVPGPLLLTAGLHWWRAHALLSILVGTATYVVLMSVW